MNRRQFLSLAAGLPAAAKAAGSPGFFRTERRNGKWLVLDPAGRPFFLRGLNHFGSGEYMPLNLNARYGSVDRWRQSLRDRHREWGFNYLPPSIGPSESTAKVAAPVRTDTGGQQWPVPIHRTPEWTAGQYAALDYPFALFLEYPRQYMAGKGLPDVFSQAFRDDVDRRCRQYCQPLRDNKNLVGYHFTHNPPWHVHNSSFRQWIEDIVAQPDGRAAWVRLMRQVYGSVDRWRRTYGLPVSSFDDIAKLDFPLRGYINKATELRDTVAFMQRVCEEWYRVYTSAVRKYDPNHLILGDRNTLHLSPLPDYAVSIMGRYVDVISFNVMGPVDVVYEVMEQVTLHWDGPLHMSDTGAGVYNGSWAKAGYMARDAAEFESIYSGYLRAGLEHPQLIGVGWCGYYETPSSRSGLVDSRTDEPIPDRVEVFRKWNTWMEREFASRHG